VEPGLGNRYQFDYAIGAAQSAFDPVAAMRFGWSFDVPFVAVYAPFSPVASRSFFSVDQPNVRIDTVKQAENSKTKREFIIRLQEVAGRNTPHVAITLPAAIKSAAIVNLTEETEIASLPAAMPLVVSLAPYQTLTVRCELGTEPRSRGSGQPE
jgi:alpha-mannosidase